MDKVCGAILVRDRRDSPIADLTVGEFADLTYFLIDEALENRLEPSELMKFYTFGETAELLGVSEPTLRKAVKAGEVQCHRVGGRILFSVDDIKNGFK